jgi:hypothetical protein
MTVEPLPVGFKDARREPSRMGIPLVVRRNGGPMTNHGRLGANHGSPPSPWHVL